MDDELLPVIDIDEPTLAEGQSGTGALGFAVTLSHQAAFPVTVDWSTSAGTATERHRLSSATAVPSRSSRWTISETVLGHGERGHHVRATTRPLQAGSLERIGRPRSAMSRGSARSPTTTRRRSCPWRTPPIVEGNTGTSLLHFTRLPRRSLRPRLRPSTTRRRCHGDRGIRLRVGVRHAHDPRRGDDRDDGRRRERRRRVREQRDPVVDAQQPRPTPPSGTAIAQGTIVNNDKRATALTLKVVRQATCRDREGAPGADDVGPSGHRDPVPQARARGS